MNRRYFLLLILFLMVAFIGRGQNVDPRCQRSTEGTEFWFGFMEGRNSYDHYVEMTVSSRMGAEFQLFIGNDPEPFENRRFTVAPNDAVRLRLPHSLVEPNGSEKILPMGLHLVADNPVNLYLLNRDRNSSDVAVIYPVQSLGTEYMAMCYTPHVDLKNPDHGRNSEFVVVASEDNTLVMITASEEPDGGGRKGVPFTVILNRGELFQVQSMHGDLTGSTIVADKPIAVYAGSLSTTIPFSATGGWDHMYEQMPPVKAWGREYYTVPLFGRSRDFFRVMAANDATLVYIGNQPPIMLNSGEFHEFTLNTPVRIVSDKPILTAQYSQSKSNDNVPNADGFMLIVNPVSQAKNDVTFVAYQSSEVKEFYVNIVVAASDIGNIELDGALVSPSRFTLYQNGKYASATLSISQGTHRLRNVREERGFIAYVYGYGGYEAFGYGVGFNLNLVLDLSDGLETQPNLSFSGDTIAICHGSSLLLDAGPYFDNYAWNTGPNDTIQEIRVSQQGWYGVTASTVDGCIQYDEIFVEVKDPKVTLGNDTLGCPHRKVLKATAPPGSGGLSSYVWSTGATTPSITISTPGRYWVTAYDSYGCPAEDSVEVAFYSVPEVKIEGERLVCGEVTGTLSVALTGPGDGWSMNSFGWSALPGAGVSFQEMTENSTDYRVPAWGRYRFLYSLTTDRGCVVADTLEAGIFQIPTSVFDFVDDPGDPCRGYSREVAYMGHASAAATLDWDFGNCHFELTSWNKARVSLAPYGVGQPFISLQVTEDECTGEPHRLSFGAAPDFTMTTDKSEACDSNLVNFTGKLNVSDHLEFFWDFGDGTTSDEQFPGHAYNQPGVFDVGLLITNPVTGCKSGFLIEEMVRIFKTPEARFEVDFPVAIVGQAHLSFFNQTQFGEEFRWEFGDGTFSADVNPRHSYLAPGRYQVVLEAVSGMGCRDTAVAEVEIIPHHVFAPNAFRPGSDIPQNRTFIPYLAGIDPGRFLLQIFNRWGEMIFESKSIDNPWSGVTRNGREAPMGNYIWKMDYVDIQGFTHSRKGEVLLIR